MSEQYNHKIFSISVRRVVAAHGSSDIQCHKAGHRMDARLVKAHYL